MTCVDKVSEPQREAEPDRDRYLDILYLSQYFHPEQFLNNHVAQALTQRRHRVQVLCCVPNYPAGRFFEGYSNWLRKREEWNGVEVRRVFTVARGKSALQLLLNYLVYPIAASWRILRLGRKGRGQISFVSMPSPLLQALAGIFAKKMWNIPTVFWVQDIWPDSATITLGIQNRFIVAVLNSICSWIYRQGDLVMVQSDGFHGKIASFGVDPARIVTLPNTAPEIFRPLEPAEIPADIRALVPGDRRTLMFAGNIGESQDFDTIIEAVKQLPTSCNLLLVVVGSGRDEDRVRARVVAEGVTERFLFLGRHPETTMPAFFACASAMLVSLRDEPIFALTVPSKVQTYMACGKPILASLASEGAAVVAGTGSGIAVPPGQPEALSQMMLRLATMPEDDLCQMGGRARDIFVERFSLSAVVDTLVDHLCKTLDKVRDQRI
jgi:colanic acid biosynthesis glycosyl transferase WcaI